MKILFINILLNKGGSCFFSFTGGISNEEREGTANISNLTNRSSNNGIVTGSEESRNDGKQAEEARMNEEKV